MKINTLTLADRTMPETLKRIAHPPQTIYEQGATLESLLRRPRLAIVGSRRVSAYGKQVTLQLARELADQGVVIISGLALGVDALAHEAALRAGGLTIAVLPGPLEHIYPATHRQLAARIAEQGGTLISEYGDAAIAHKGNFVARNRLVAGLAQAVLITEAAEKSGSLHTARFALEQGKDVLAVPGNITNPGSVGTNNLIKAGATPVTSVLDVLHVLGLTPHTTSAATVRGRNANEQRILDLLLQGMNEGEALLQASRLSASEFNQVLTMLEIGGKIRSLGANNWTIC